MRRPWGARVFGHVVAEESKAGEEFLGGFVGREEFGALVERAAARTGPARVGSILPWGSSRRRRSWK